MAYRFKIELEEDVKGRPRQTVYMKWRFSKAQGNLGTFSVCGELYIKSPDFYQIEMLAREITLYLDMFIPVKGSCMDAVGAIKVWLVQFLLFRNNTD